MIHEDISRTKENAYNKIDQERFMRRPRHEEVPFTSFLSVRDMILSEPGKGFSPKKVEAEEVKRILDAMLKQDMKKRIYE